MRSVAFNFGSRFLLLIELFLLLLKVAVLKFLSCFVEGCVTFILLFITLLLDLFKRHADDSLLEASGFSSLFTLDLINLDFLIDLLFVSVGFESISVISFSFLLIGWISV